MRKGWVLNGGGSRTERAGGESHRGGTVVGWQGSQDRRESGREEWGVTEEGQ